MKDLLNADEVEVIVDQFGKVWVNVDGQCVLRVGKAASFVVEDTRTDVKTRRSITCRSQSA